MEPYPVNQKLEGPLGIRVLYATTCAMPRLDMIPTWILCVGPIGQKKNKPAIPRPSWRLVVVEAVSEYGLGTI